MGATRGLLLDAALSPTLTTTTGTSSIAPKSTTAFADTAIVLCNLCPARVRSTGVARRSAEDTPGDASRITARLQGE